jgi:hypothetical protein
MSWTLSGIRIFVSETKEEASQIVPRLQPLSGGTVLQTFGYESDIYTIGAIAVGDTDKDALKALRTGGTAALVEIRQDEHGGTSTINHGTFTVKNVSVQRIHCLSQSILIDGSHSCDDPIYQLEIQLYD